MKKSLDDTGYVILLTGISGSGKTTIGSALHKILKKMSQRPIDFIDGDSTRQFFEHESNFTVSERNMITKQIAYGAYLLAKNGIDVIVANIAGKYEIRDFLRRKWKRYIQVFLDADIEDCIKNDPKGVYKKALRLDKPQICGKDIVYERPRNPDLVVYPYKEDLSQSIDRIIAYLRKKNFLISKHKAMKNGRRIVRAKNSA